MEYFSRTFRNGFVCSLLVSLESATTIVRGCVGSVGEGLAKNFVMIFLNEMIALGIWNSVQES